MSPKEDPLPPVCAGNRFARRHVRHPDVCAQLSGHPIPTHGDRPICAPPLRTGRNAPAPGRNGVRLVQS
eukprot:7811164-Alexandrium_andersonii.AAC.1